MTAPAPTTATAPADAILVARAPLAHFAPSLTNRKHTAAHITDLANSIKIDKVAQPITARPWPASRGDAPPGVLYEIVIGEGRWRGSEEAGEADIPFFWRDLTDEQALRLQLVENLKRKDLTEIEEAEGYRRLMKDHGYSAERIADEIGKSRSHVYGRLKLLDLCPAALAIVQEHKLDATIAVLIARIADPKLQTQAAKEIARPWHTGSEPLSYRKAAEHVQANFMLKLAEAPFPRADIELVPIAGRCHDCPKRTGNARDLYDDVKSADVCTDPPCYHAKSAAHAKRQQDLAKAEGRKIIKGDEAKKLKPYHHTDVQGGYVALDKTVQVDGKQKTVRQILGDAAPQADLLEDPHKQGHLIEVVPAATIRDQLEAKGVLGQVTNHRLKTAQEKADQKAEKLREKIDTTFSQRLFDQIRSHIIQYIDGGETEAPYLEIEEERMVLQRFFDLTPYGLQARAARIWFGPKDENFGDYHLTEELKDRIDGMDRKEIAKLMLDLTLIAEVGEARPPKRMLDIAKNMAIDADALKVEIRKELTPKEKAKPAEKKEKVQPAAAISPADPLQVGDSVRILVGIHAGRTGTIKAIKEGSPLGYSVGLTLSTAAAWPFPTTESLVFLAHELQKLPAATPSTPSKAAPAGERKAEKPAAPATKPKATAKKPKVKDNPAPAMPANEAATPPKAAASPEGKAKATIGDLFPDAPEFPQPNEHGVYPEDKAEVFEWKTGKHLVTIKVLQVAEGWIPNLHVKYKDGSFGGGIMVRDGIHPCREEAISGGAKDARHMLLAPKADYGYTAAQKKSLGEWLGKLEAAGEKAAA